MKTRLLIKLLFGLSLVFSFNGFSQDTDGDNIVDAIEGTTIDTDGDGILDYLDIDDDNDGLTTINENQYDTDGDNLPDYLDLDSDNDGISDNVEAQDTMGYIPPAGIDSNGDGLDDAYLALNSPNSSFQDTDGDGIEDYLDLDSDNDNVPDNIEGNDQNHDGIADSIATGSDIDDDGLDDSYENDAINIVGSDPLLDLPNNDASDDVDYRDIDDDNDGVLTIDEDANNNGNYYDDDVDLDGTPDYLDADTASVADNLLVSFTLYPIPVNNLLSIKLEELSNNTTFTIYNLQGKVVYKKQEILNQQTEINITNFSSGVYFIKLASDNNTAIKKFVKK